LSRNVRGSTAFHLGGNRNYWLVDTRGKTSEDKSKKGVTGLREAKYYI
jgi:hypothetical protein